MKSLYDALGAPRPFDPTHRFTTSWLLPPLALASLRFLLSLYAFTTIFVIFGYDDAHHNSLAVRQSFSYFTNLGYFGLAFYFLFSGLHTFSYARSGGRGGGSKSWLQSWPRPLQAAHSLFYTSIVTYPLLVTVVFWAILYSGHWFPVVFNGWSNTSQHALNTVFAAFEILVTRTEPPPLMHLLLLVVILALYVALAYITRASEGFYPYSFLDPHEGGSGRVAGYAFGILAAVVVIFAVVWGVIWLRRWITEKRLGMEGKFAKVRGIVIGSGEDLEMMAERRK